MKMQGSKQMYSHSPKLERDKDGKVGISKKPAEAEKEIDKAAGGTDGMPVHEMHAHERREMAHKHVKEHLDLHHKHETHHAMHKGEKKHLHMRHLEEKKALHGAHEKEMADMQSRHEGDGMIESGEE